MVEGPVAHQASTPPRTALREALLNGFSGAVAGVLRHRIGGGRNGLWDTLATCLSDAPKAYVDAPWWASPTFRRGRGGSLVRYCRMSGLLMQRLLAAGRMVFVRSDPNRESGLKGPPLMRYVAARTPETGESCGCRRLRPHGFPVARQICPPHLAQSGEQARGSTLSPRQRDCWSDTPAAYPPNRPA